jgi:hypothetical protein
MRQISIQSQHNTKEREYMIADFGLLAERYPLHKTNQEIIPIIIQRNKLLCLVIF